MPCGKNLLVPGDGIVVAQPARSCQGLPEAKEARRLPQGDLLREVHPPQQVLEARVGV